MDTLKTARNLEARGFTRDQAEAVADAIGETGLTGVKRDVDVLKWMAGVLIVLVTAIVWQLFTLSSVVARPDERVAAQSTRLDRVEQRLTAVEQQFAVVGQALQALTDRIGGLASRLPPRP